MSTVKPGKMGENCPVREKSENFEHIIVLEKMEFTQNTGKITKFQKNVFNIFFCD